MFEQHAIRNPAFAPEVIVPLVEKWYGFKPAQLKPLASFQDQNFRVTAESGERYVLKIANAHETRETLDLQNRAMQHVLAKDPTFPTPRVMLSQSGEAILAAEHDGEQHFVRLLTYLPGLPLGELPYQPNTLLAEMGDTVGRLTQHLQDFTHPAEKRVIQWDLRHATDVSRAFLKFVADGQRRRLIEKFIARFETEAEAQLPELRTSVIHGDIVDYNLLVARDAYGGARVSGIIDFGDAVRSYTTGELAVLLATVLAHNARAPLSAAARVVRAYHYAFPLTEPELTVLFPLICLRVCATTTSAAQQASLAPGNAYVQEFAEAEWPLLDLLDALSPAHALAHFRHACGLEPHPRATRVREWLTGTQPGKVIDADLTHARVLDLSAGSPDLRDGEGSVVTEGPALGRYGEARLRHTRYDSADEPHTVQLGVDVFAGQGASVFAPLAGVVAACDDNALTLRHETPEAGAFFTRYANLRLADGLREQDSVQRGQIIGAVASHLHFQLACEWPAPSRCAGSERAVWLSICPDPNLILRVPALHPADSPRAEDVLRRRRASLAQSQETYYRQPPRLVRGWRQYLIDEHGRAYLDSVNNVALVGHCHPRVVEAAHRQMRLLNTNNRFLYDSLVSYAERLKALLPDSLSVVFFVCSGSEANDLALRLARTYAGGEDTLTLDGAYNGNTIATYEISTSRLDNPTSAKAVKPYIHPVPQPNLYRGPYGDEARDAGMKYADYVRKAIEALREQGRQPAAFIAECLLGAPGGMRPPRGFFPQVYQAVREAGGVCIADEVQVGFGRMGTHFWAFEMQGVVPDIVTMGKPMGNGHPVSAVATTPEIAEAFRRAYTYFNTFGGNPVACEVGMAVLDVMRDEGLQENARVVGEHFQTGLTALMDKHALIGAVHGWGMYLGVEFVRDREAKTPATEEAMRVCERMLEYGVVVYPTGDYYNILKIKPPLVWTAANADFFVACLDRVLTEGW